MEELLFVGYAFAASFIPFLIVFESWRKIKRVRLSGISVSMMLLFVMYMTGVFYVTGSGTFEDVQLYQLSWVKHTFHLIPFSNDIDIMGYLLNILLLMPLGIFVPLLCEKVNQFSHVFGIGLSVSLLVETSQLLNARSTDVDDLIMNTFGAVLGFLLYRLWNICTKSNYQVQQIPLSVLVVSILVSFIGRFFLFREMMLAQWLYDF